MDIFAGHYSFLRGISFAYIRRRPSVARVEESGDSGHSSEHRDVSKESTSAPYRKGLVRAFSRNLPDTIGYDNHARVVRHPARDSGGRLDVSG